MSTIKAMNVYAQPQNCGFDYADGITMAFAFVPSIDVNHLLKKQIFKLDRKKYKHE